MRMPIVIFEDEQKKIDIDPAVKIDMISCMAHAIELEKYFEDTFEVGVTFTDNEHIKEINGEQRGKPVVTDVLSFPMFTLDELKKRDFSFDDCDPQNRAVILGDIVISVERALLQAEEYGHSLRRELCFLAVHSTLHLLGYDHEESQEVEDYMFSRQSEVLNDLKITRDNG
jgi:metalloprotein, YbeY/UPF0054 family